MTLLDLNFMKILRFSIFIVLLSVCHLSMAQTARSLFWRSDSLQVSEIVSEIGNQYNKVGHHGPAVENSHMALRLYFNDTGAIDVFSKSGRGMELMDHKWYTDMSDYENGIGFDAYMVGKTIGLGGIALWDGEKEVKLVATKGRTARVGETRKGDFAEIIAYGVEYKGGFVDISIRIDVTQKSREAIVTATELNGVKVEFLTGVNYHPGARVNVGEDYISVWGIHPTKKGMAPFAVGAGMFFNDKLFPNIEKTEDMVRLISRPCQSVKTRIISASTMEAEINSAKRFEAYMAK